MSNNGNGNTPLENNELKDKEVIDRNIQNFKEFINEKTVLSVRINKDTNQPEWITTLQRNDLIFLFEQIKFSIFLPKPKKIIEPNVVPNTSRIPFWKKIK